MNKKLELRKKIKSKKPGFLREDWHKKKRVCATSWRRPKGRHSKMRHNFQGHPACVNPGYGSPREVKGMHKSGLHPVNVHNGKELKALDKSRHAVIISAAVGQRKKVGLVKKASELGLKVINVKNPSAFVKKVEEQMSKKKSIKTDKKKTEKKEVKKVEKKEEAPASREEKKKKETKELEKVLTKREK